MILVGAAGDGDGEEEDGGGAEEAEGEDWGWWGLRRETVGAPGGATVRSRANLGFRSDDRGRQWRAAASPPSSGFRLLGSFCRKRRRGRGGRGGGDVGEANEGRTRGGRMTWRAARGGSYVASFLGSKSSVKVTGPPLP
ncbi:hypothetical protein NL676_034216 [Syzygium grande]|nr:hypothetical protein NL676_034216 [Syzygium grande]